MKKRIIVIITVMFLLVLGLAGCKGKHNFSSDWSSDATSHWHACSHCDEVQDKADHTWNTGEVTTPATSTAKGEKTYTCTVCGATKTEEIDKLQSVAAALALANNANVEFSGVVFGKTNEGLYLSDGSTGAYVKLAESQASKLAGVKTGDEIKVSGKLSVSASQIFIKNASVDTLASGKTAISADTKTIEVIQALAATDRANFGKLFKVTVAVSEDEAGRMVWTDSTGALLLDDSAKADFASYIGKKVTANVTLLKMGDGNDGWIAYAFKASAEEYIVDIDTVKDEIFASVHLDEEVWGVLELPTTYKSEPGVAFTWSVKEGEGITIENNVADVSLALTEDSNVTLTLTLSSGTKSASQDFTVKVMAIESVSLATGKTKDGYVVLNATAAACGISNESTSYHYVILMDDNTKEYAIVCVSSEQRASVKPGNKVQVVAKWDALGSYEGLFAYQDVKALKVTAEGEALDYSTLDAVELRTVADYQNAIENNHQQIVLYKIVNPWMVGSGSTTFSWYQFGPGKDSAANGLINTRQFCFLIANFAANGMTQWESQYQVPIKTDGANHYAGTVIYAYSVYQLGETKWPFIIPNVGCSIQDVSEAVRNAIEENVETEVVAQEAGTFTLPASVTVDETEYAITWESSNSELLNASTGAYPQLLDPAEVTLTAKYTCNLKEYSFSFKLTMLAAEITPITISEAITAASATETGSLAVAKLSAYIAAIGTSSENAEEYRYGIMITDGKRVVYYQTTDYKVGEVDLKSGDELEIRGATINVDADGATLQGGTVILKSSNNTIDWTNLEVAATVSNDEELATFLAGHNATRGLVVKFTGTMNIVGTGSTSKNPRYQVNYKQAAASADARYSMNGTNRSLVLSLNAYKLLDPDNEWWTALGIPPTTGSKCFTICGSFYAVGGYNGATMQAWTIIKPAEIDINGTIETIVTPKMDALINTEEISAAAAGELTLPEKVTYNAEGELAITWESSDTNAMTAAGAYNAVTQDTQVTLTAKVTVGNKQLSKAFTITLKAAEAKKLTVSEVLALEDGAAVEAMVATVAGFSTGTSGTAATYPTQAMYLTDGTSVIGLDAFKGDLKVASYDVTFGEENTLLAVGDKVELTNLTKTKQSVQATDSTTVSKTGKEEGNAWFAPTVDADHTIDSQDDIAALMLTITANSVKCATTHDYVVYKIVGTAENPLYLGRGNGYVVSMFYKGELANDAAITATVVTPGTGYTIGNGKYCYFCTHVASLGKAINNDEWAIANTVISEKSGDYVYKATAGATIFTYGYVGEMYIIQSSTGTSSYPYIMYGVLGAGFNLTKVQ
ncbi:MAG: hypothetical protein J6W64_10565 [Bacilli bacterium]|nr:hypothetical protein [Bacilli bacterium]